MFNRRFILVKAFKLFDMLVMLFCFSLAMWISNPQLNGLNSFNQFFTARIKLINFGLFIGMVLAWHVILSVFNLYKSKRLFRRNREIFEIIKATLVGSILIFLSGKLFQIEIINKHFIVYFWLISCSVMIASHLIIRRGLELFRRRGKNLRYMLIAGTNPRAIAFARKIESKPELGYRIRGFVDSSWEGTKEFHQSGYKIVTDFDGFQAYLREKVVDEVVISLPLKSKYMEASLIAEFSQIQGITVLNPPDIFDLKTSKTKASSLEDIPLISNCMGEMNGWQVEIKRIFDILTSSLALIVLSPIYLITAVLLKFTSPGPVFFTQDRLGINKRLFKMYKFRTMAPDAEEKQDELEVLNEASGPVFKIKKDPRIISLGRILRKLSIDELPQLFNVLKGDMSIVGPRPLPIRDYNGFSEDWHRRRFSVRPGITCLWQVNGRSETSFEEWMALDMKYIDNWSLGLDIVILIKTIPAVIKGSGAA